jgi:HlyD family secretion protein
VREGDFVTAGQVVALMDTDVLNGQLREAEAQLQRAQSTAATARSQLVQRQAEKAAAQAVIRPHEVKRDVAQKRVVRTLSLAAEDMTPQQKVEDDRV